MIGMQSILRTHIIVIIELAPQGSGVQLFSEISVSLMNKDMFAFPASYFTSLIQLFHIIGSYSSSRLTVSEYLGQSISNIIEKANNVNTWVNQYLI